MKTLSIRQPWAWLIVNGHKDIENRNWHTNFRGRALIHAGKGMTKAEYEDCFYCAEDNGIELPKFADLQRGGVVGAADIVGCVSESQSPWFFGDYGFQIARAVPCEFVHCNGELGFFDLPRSIFGTTLSTGARP